MTESPRFEEITVERINVVNKDGDKRLVLTSEERCPPPIVDGREPDRSGGGRVGILFYNERGDECGGLAFSGKEVDGVGTAHSLLAFDQYRNDQIIGLLYQQEGESRGCGLQIWDHDPAPMTQWIDQVEAVEGMPDGPEKEDAEAKLPPWGTTRLFLGRDGSGEILLTMMDSKGKPRIQLGIGLDDQPKLEFLDAEGRVTHRLMPASAATSA